MSTKKAHQRPKNTKKNGKGASRPPYRGAERAPKAPQNSRGDAPRLSLRAPSGSYFLWGSHALNAALANPQRLIKALYCTSESAPRLDQALNDCGQERLKSLPTPQIVDKSLLDNLSVDGSKAVHQGLVAAVMPLDQPIIEDYLDALDDGQPVRVMMLDQVSDPRNIGAILRSARAFGVDALILQDRNTPEEAGTLARTAVGALEEVKLIRVVNLARACDELKAAGFYLAGLDMDGNSEIGDMQKQQRLCLIMGSEGKGMRRLTKEACDEILAIEMADSSESLNVSVAAAIIMHQTQFKS